MYAATRNTKNKTNYAFGRDSIESKTKYDYIMLCFTAYIAMPIEFFTFNFLMILFL
jgi:hypothetical protein